MNSSVKKHNIMFKSIALLLNKSGFVFLGLLVTRWVTMDNLIFPSKPQVLHLKQCYKIALTSHKTTM